MRLNSANIKHNESAMNVNHLLLTIDPPCLLGLWQKTPRERRNARSGLKGWPRAHDYYGNPFSNAMLPKDIGLEEVGPESMEENVGLTSLVVALYPLPATLICTESNPM